MIYTCKVFKGALLAQEVEHFIGNEEVRQFESARELHFYCFRARLTAGFHFFIANTAETLPFSLIIEAVLDDTEEKSYAYY